MGHECAVNDAASPPTEGLAAQIREGSTPRAHAAVQDVGPAVQRWGSLESNPGSGRKDKEERTRRSGQQKSNNKIRKVRACKHKTTDKCVGKNACRLAGATSTQPMPHPPARPGAGPHLTGPNWLVTHASTSCWVSTPQATSRPSSPRPMFHSASAEAAGGEAEMRCRLRRQGGGMCCL